MYLALPESLLMSTLLSATVCFPKSTFTFNFLYEKTMILYGGFQQALTGHKDGTAALHTRLATCEAPKTDQIGAVGAGRGQFLNTTRVRRSPSWHRAKNFSKLWFTVLRPPRISHELFLHRAHTASAASWCFWGTAAGEAQARVQIQKTQAAIGALTEGTLHFMGRQDKKAQTPSCSWHLISPLIPPSPPKFPPVPSPPYS